MSTVNPLIVAAATKLWIVNSESVGCPALIGQTMRVERAGNLGPQTPRYWVITPADASPTDERWGGLFKNVKPNVLAVSDRGLMCSGGIELSLKETA